MSHAELTLAGPRGLAALRAAVGLRPVAAAAAPTPAPAPTSPADTGLHRFDRAPQEVASGWRARLSADEIDLLEQSTAETLAALEQRQFSTS